MFGLSLATRISISLDAVDMRRGFDGLFGLVRDRLGEDPLSGHLRMDALFLVHREARRQGMTAAERQALRRECSASAGNGEGVLPLR